MSACVYVRAFDASQCYTCIYTHFCVCMLIQTWYTIWILWFSQAAATHTHTHTHTHARTHTCPCFSFACANLICSFGVVTLASRGVAALKSCSYVCMCVRVIVCTYACLLACMYVCACMHVCKGVCLYVCVFACMYVCACMHLCKGVCAYACLFVCMYVCATHSSPYSTQNTLYMFYIFLVYNNTNANLSLFLYTVAPLLLNSSCPPAEQ